LQYKIIFTWQICNYKLIIQLLSTFMTIVCYLTCVWRFYSDVGLRVDTCLEEVVALTVCLTTVVVVMTMMDGQPRAARDGRMKRFDSTSLNLRAERTTLPGKQVLMSSSRPLRMYRPVEIHHKIFKIYAPRFLKLMLNRCVDHCG